MVQVHAGPQRSNRGVGVVQEGVVEIVLLLGVSSRSDDCKPLQGCMSVSWCWVKSRERVYDLVGIECLCSLWMVSSMGVGE